MRDEEIDTLSVLARQCIAVCCLERFCKKFEIAHPDVQRFIDHVWQVTQVNPDNWNEWEKGFSELPVSGFGDPLPDGVRSCIPESLRSTFDRLLQHVFETSASTWYGNDLPATKRQLLSVLHICQQYEVQTPSITPFLHHPKQENGWGPCLTDQEVQAWRQMT